MSYFSDNVGVSDQLDHRRAVLMTLAEMLERSWYPLCDDIVSGLDEPLVEHQQLLFSFFILFFLN